MIVMKGIPLSLSSTANGMLIAAPDRKGKHN
jgi:hypothetical protein